jgi:hypothetical protein
MYTLLFDSKEIFKLFDLSFTWLKKYCSLDQGHELKFQVSKRVFHRKELVPGLPP